MTLKDYLKAALINFGGLRWAFNSHWRLARGRLEGDWEKIIFPESDPELRRALFRWSRILLTGHGLIRHDLPPSPRGLLRTWREIAEIQKRQKEEPAYQYKAVIPFPA